MMKRIALAAALACLAAPAFAPAFADVAATLTGKTVVVHDGQGKSTAYQLGDDGDMAFTASDGRSGSGGWKVGADGKLCLTPDSSTFCLPVAADVKVGDTWAVNGPTGQVAFRIDLADKPPKFDRD